MIRNSLRKFLSYLVIKPKYPQTDICQPYPTCLGFTIYFFVDNIVYSHHTLSKG